MEKPILKALYTMDPLIGELELQDSHGKVRIKPSLMGTAIVIAGNQGQFIDLFAGSLKSTLQLTPSLLLRASTICDYLFFDGILVVLRADGLLYSWASNQDHFSKLVQTSFREKDFPNNDYKQLF